MKKIYTLFYLVMFPYLSSAYDIQVDGIYYNLIPKNQTAEVTYGPIKYQGHIDIPELIIYENNEYNVTSIAGDSFSNCTELLSVRMHNTIKSIGTRAFSRCSNLKSVVLSENITYISERLFDECTNLRSIVVPDKVTSIENWAFYNCSKLISIVLSKNLTSIGKYVFWGCKSLSSIDLPSSVVEIGYGAFRACSNLESIILPNSVVTIGDALFVSCNKLRTVTLPTNMISIGNSFFFGCGKLTAISIPERVTTIGNYAFGYCTSLSSIIIPNNVQSIDETAFLECSNLRSVVLGTKISYISSKAFYRCPELKTVICYAADAPTAEADIFEGSFIDNIPLYVPRASMESYSSKSPWNFFEIRSVEDYFFLNYYIDNAPYTFSLLEQGQHIIPEPIPNREGYTFSGWSEIPVTMPAYDVTVTGSFIVNKYQVTYIIDGEVFATDYVEYGAAIVPPTVEEKEGLKFSGWADVPETMPAHNITIYGSFTSGIAEIVMATNNNVRIYSPNGKKIDKMLKGLNIVVLKDGTVKKIVVK